MGLTASPHLHTVTGHYSSSTVPSTQVFAFPLGEEMSIKVLTFMNKSSKTNLLMSD